MTKAEAARLNGRKGGRKPKNSQAEVSAPLGSTETQPEETQETHDAKPRTQKPTETQEPTDWELVNEPPDGLSRKERLFVAGRVLRVSN